MLQIYRENGYFQILQHASYLQSVRQMAVNILIDIFTKLLYDGKKTLKS